MAAKVAMENALEEEGSRVCSGSSGGGELARERGEGGGVRGVGVRRNNLMEAGVSEEEEEGDGGCNGAGVVGGWRQMW